jgi:oxalate decarboxylase
MFTTDRRFFLQSVAMGAGALAASQARAAAPDSAEWAYVVEGHCQVSVLDPEGQFEAVNLGPGDLWYFPKGHSHAIQTLGASPCHAILAFDDGLYSEHGTFGISDWMSRYDTPLLSLALGVSGEAFAQIPKAETYIMQGEVLPLDGPQARSARALDHDRTHRYALMAQKPRVSTSGGALWHQPTSFRCRRR